MSATKTSLKPGMPTPMQRCAAPSTPVETTAKISTRDAMLAFNADFHKDSQALFRVGTYMNVLARDQILIQAYGISPDDRAALDGHDVIPMVEWQSASGMPTRLAIRYAGEQEATLAWGKPQTGVTSLTDCLSDPAFCDRLCVAVSL